MSRKEEGSASGTEAAKGTGGTVLDLRLANGCAARLVAEWATPQEEKAVFDALDLLVSEAVRQQFDGE